MLRLVGFFLIVMAILSVLREVPVVGAIFRIPLLGFWLTAIGLSVALSRFAARAIDRRQQKKLERQLGAVDTPHNQGKLGSLILSQGRARQAIPHLEQAAAGEPESLEWRYRLGLARLEARDLAGAREALESTAAGDEEYAYGAVLLRLAETLTKLGEAQAAFETLERFERNHGPSPESAYRRGVALRTAGHGDRARAAFREVRELASQYAENRRAAERPWVLRSYFAR